VAPQFGEFEFDGVESCSRRFSGGRLRELELAASALLEPGLAALRRDLPDKVNVGS
jgi:hypothetical protein